MAQKSERVEMRRRPHLTLDEEQGVEMRRRPHLTPDEELAPDARPQDFSINEAVISLHFPLENEEACSNFNTWLKTHFQIKGALKEGRLIFTDKKAAFLVSVLFLKYQFGKNTNSDFIQLSKFALEKYLEIEHDPENFIIFFELVKEEYEIQIHQYSTLLEIAKALSLPAELVDAKPVVDGSFASCQALVLKNQGLMRLNRLLYINILDAAFEFCVRHNASCDSAILAKQKILLLYRHHSPAFTDIMRSCFNTTSFGQRIWGLFGRNPEPTAPSLLETARLIEPRFYVESDFECDAQVRNTAQNELINLPDLSHLREKIFILIRDNKENIAFIEKFSQFISFLQKNACDLECHDLNKCGIHHLTFKTVGSRLRGNDEYAFLAL